jgi:hypothetical protein
MNTIITNEIQMTESYNVAIAKEKGISLQKIVRLHI